jgi:hypothetical protein
MPAPRKCWALTEDNVSKDMVYKARKSMNTRREEYDWKTQGITSVEADSLPLPYL